jgi:hypothetical protein
MNDLENFIATYENGQRQKHAHLLKTMKYEFYQLRDEQRRAALHRHHGATPPRSMEAQPDRTRADKNRRS